MAETPTGPTLPFLTRLHIRLIHILYSNILRQNGTINRSIVNLLVPKTPPNPTTPIHGVFTTDHHHHHHNLSFRVFTPQTQSQHQKLPLIIYLHGGGFFVQTADTSNCHTIARNLCFQLSAIIASLTYRLSPEHKYPSQHQDVFNFLQYLSTHPDILPNNADLSNTILIGDSAGANLAHFAAAQFSSSSSPSPSTFNSIKLKAVVLIQPFFGGQERTDSELRLFHGPLLPVWVSDWMWKAYLPEGADRDHAACHVTGPNAVDKKELQGFPRSLVVVGGFDPLQDWQWRYCEWLRKAGKEVDVVEFPNGIHGFYTFPELEDTNMLYEELRKFVYKL
ncbi:unnamed protein product [Rhodiola kirilowii]